jgi:F-type H+-transporting ATPase subunit alpha
VGEFEQGFLTLLRTDNQALLAEIRDRKEITDDTRAKLRAAADSFAKVFG